MGLVYLTLGGGSAFHLDARGQMDSGHICLSGYNHVIMFRRLSPSAIDEAMNLLSAATTISDDKVGTCFSIPPYCLRTPLTVVPTPCIILSLDKY